MSLIIKSSSLFSSIYAASITIWSENEIFDEIGADGSSVRVSRRTDEHAVLSTCSIPISFLN